jgi:hypothetical protein
VIVDHVYLEGVPSAPTKNDSPLIVDPDGVKTFPNALEPFETIARRDCQIAQLGCVVKVQLLSTGGPAELGWKRPGSPRSLVIEEVLGQGVAKGLDHVVRLS